MIHGTSLVCFDLDETLITQNSWYVLNRALGMTQEENLSLYNAYKAGTLTTDAWTQKRLAIYKACGKASRENIQKILSVYELMPGARELVTYVQSKYYHTALISGSIDQLVTLVANDLHIPHSKANYELIFDDHDMLSDIISYGDETYAKLTFLTQFCAELNIPVAECICIGDGANDIEMFRQTRGITFTHAPEIIKQTAWRVVDSLSDIHNIL